MYKKKQRQGNLSVASASALLFISGGFTCMPAIGFFEWMSDGLAALGLTSLMQFTQIFRIEIPGHPNSEVCGF